MSRTFVDTNVWVYAQDGAEERKQDQAVSALAGLAADDIVISFQVLTEFYAIVTRTPATPLTPSAAITLVEHITDLRVGALDAGLIVPGLRASIKHQLSSWDGLMIAAAASAGCDRLLTEDLNTGATYEGVTIVNPFG